MIAAGKGHEASLRSLLRFWPHHHNPTETEMNYYLDQVVNAEGDELQLSGGDDDSYYDDNDNEEGCGDDKSLNDEDEELDSQSGNDSRNMIRRSVTSSISSVKGCIESIK